ncbi:MAG: flagellin [Gemmatimonadetes bacterium]|nr:MAG: flagellin [Gemmatimonadota bacterium]
MRINTNVDALSTLRKLDKSGAAFSRSIGRLSSGFRINTAADDAAGLGIANTLRGDIRALQQASRNAEQGRSLLQVAEGATSEIQNILERMKELAAQAASSNSGDRIVLNNEFSELRNEIDRIVKTTEFQNNKLLDGSFSQAVDAANSTIDSNGAVQFDTISVSGLDTAATYTLTKVSATQVKLSDGSNEQTVTVSSTGAQDVTFSAFGVKFRTNASFDISGNNDAFSANNTFKVTGSSAQFLVSASGAYSTDDLVTLGNLDLRVDQASGLNINTASISSQSNAQTALTTIDSAISKVSSALATIGSAQNRIDFARANTEATIENFSAAESVIRDADIAREVTEMTKFQILQQAGTAMLAQANAAPQSVLQLLG